VVKTEGRRPLGRPRRRYEDNIKMKVRDIGRGGTDWIDLTLVCERGNEPPGFVSERNFFSSSATFCTEQVIFSYLYGLDKLASADHSSHVI
jgi:hypothetical protein